MAQILGISFASGLNLYATVAALGIAARIGIADLPPGLVGLDSLIVLGSALALFIVEAVVDKIRHADSLWDAIHTFVRPPAAALLTVGILWGSPPLVLAAGAVAAFTVALAAHAAKAGLRLSLNTRHRDRPTTWISIAEDIAAATLAAAAVSFPPGALIAGIIALLAVMATGPRLWRAFTLGIRCLASAIRAFFGTGTWKDEPDLPRRVRTGIDRAPMGSAPPRGARAAMHGARGVGAYRSGWLLITAFGPIFSYRTLLGRRHMRIPPVDSITVEGGAWADLLQLKNGKESLTLFVLRDGPPAELAATEIQSSSQLVDATSRPQT
ncbi:MAG TPA: DUF4126 domain-containing protein [Longimicrobiales bacterium]|nr:DUF4126 domain-containing protein [Longimicrobiales bacterium]